MFPSHDPNNNSNKLWTEKGYRCSEWGELQQQLIDELVDFPGNVIIPMGATAMHLLLDEPRFEKISKLRGSIYRAEEFPHLAKPLAGKLIALTYHPASTLPRNMPINFYVMISDFVKFKKVSDDPSLLDVKVNLITEPSFREVEQFFELLKGFEDIAFDIEATPNFITCFSLAVAHDDEITSMSIPLMNNQGHYWTEKEETLVWIKLAKILGNQDKKIICQNGMFDLTYCLRSMGITTSNFDFDTMQAQHIVYPDLPKGLDFLTSVYTYFPYYKDEGKLSHMTLIKDWKKYWLYNAARS